MNKCMMGAGPRFGMRRAHLALGLAAALAMAAHGGRHGPGPFGFGGGGPRGGGPFGPFGPFGSFPGPPFGRRPRARRGDVRAGILALLAEGPRNGYQIIQELGERSQGAWNPSPGSVYPTLEGLKDEGLVIAEQHDGQRAFALTDAGRAYVEERGEGLAAPWEGLADAADDGMRELRDLFMQVGAATMQVAQAGTAAQRTEARQVLANARRAIYRILAEDAPADAEGDPGAVGNA